MIRIKDYYGRLNLQNKLRFSYILLILIPVTFLCIVYYWVSSQSILDVAENNILDVIIKNTEIMDQQLESIQANAANLNVDFEIYQLLADLQDASASELLVKDKRVKTVLHKYFSSDYILSATIMTPRYVFGDNSRLVIPNELFYKSNIYQIIKGRPGEAQWIPTYQVKDEFDLDYPVDDSTIFSLTQLLNPVLIDPETPNDVRYVDKEPEEVLIVNIKEDLMENIFSGSNSVKGSYYCVSSKDGVIVAHSDQSKSGTTEELPWMKEAAAVKSGSMLLTYQGQSVVTCFAVSEVTGWVSAAVTPVNSLLNNVSKIQFLTIVVWIVIFVLAMFLASVFSRRITQPVESLVKAMKQVGKGDFSLRLPTKGNDEMQYLTEKYNEMGEKIQILIEENYKSEIRNKESEIMALNLQLNPHFLYNTLNIINMMVLEDGNEEVSSMLLSLSDMLQYTFRNRQEIVVFEEEYLWLQNYLHIMQIRFEGKFQTEYEVSSEIFKYQVPKLLLQPFVENSIVHGFRKMQTGGRLYIRGRKEQNGLYLEIEDNGQGMNKEQLKRAMEGGDNRIGLGNAVQRLHLLYGEEGRLKVITEEGKGTKIIVRFPFFAQ